MLKYEMFPLRSSRNKWMFSLAWIHFMVYRYCRYSMISCWRYCKLHTLCKTRIQFNTQTGNIIFVYLSFHKCIIHSTSQTGVVLSNSARTHDDWPSFFSSPTHSINHPLKRTTPQTNNRFSSWLFQVSTQSISHFSIFSVSKGLAIQSTSHLAVSVRVRQEEREQTWDPCRVSDSLGWSLTV